MRATLAAICLGIWRRLRMSELLSRSHVYCRNDASPQHASRHAKKAIMRTRQSVLQTPCRSESVWLIVVTLLMAVLSLMWAPEVAQAANASTYGSGEVTEYSTYAVGEMLSDSYFYSDAWFLEDPSVQNDELALASMQ